MVLVLMVSAKNLGLVSLSPDSLSPDAFSGRIYEKANQD